MDKNRYIEQFKTAWDAIDHSRWSADAIEINVRSLRIPTLEEYKRAAQPLEPDEYEVIPATFASIYNEDKLPDPEELAAFLDEFIWRMACDEWTGLMHHWRRFELMEVEMNLPITFDTPSPTKKVGAIVVRTNWGIEFTQDFDYDRHRMRVRGRYGFLKKEVCSNVSMED